MKLFIISYNRLSFLKQQIEFFSYVPDLDIHIVDNASIYPPLIKYLLDLDLNTNIKMHRHFSNFGHKVVWERNISKSVCANEPYLVTDNDIIPEDKNFVQLLTEGLEKFPDVNKVGLGLRCDDIPKDSSLGIIKTESSLPKEKTNDPRFVRMPVDTTLAIYRAGYHNYSPWGLNNKEREPCLALRTTQSLAKHLSWYLTEEEMKNEENQFYFNSLKQGSSHWSAMQADKFKK